MVYVSKKLIALFRSYLTNRQQYVYLNLDGIEYRSQFKVPTSSVPQGTILGPLLFLIYVNHLPELSTSRLTTMFCDDTTVLYIGSDHEEAEIRTSVSLNKFIQDLSWFNLTVNAEKTKFVKFTGNKTIKPNEDSFNILVDDREITEVDSVRFLGLHIDSNLSWKSHVENQINKLSGALFLL